jgi:hypothetical protein
MRARRTARNPDALACPTPPSRVRGRSAARAVARALATALALTTALALGLPLTGCENRKARCRELLREINRCNPKGFEPSDRQRREFLANCQKEYDRGTVKKTRECVARHEDCAARKACIRQALQIEPTEPTKPTKPIEPME